VIVLSEETILQTNNILLFGKYGLSEVVVKDGGLSKYINLNPVLVPHSNAKHANRWFGKSKVNIVERLINNMMRTEVFTGKKLKAYRTVKDAFEIIAERTKKNPVQVLVEALENAAPRKRSPGCSSGAYPSPRQWT
jgi:small subunit ribosomal protein S7